MLFQVSRISRDFMHGTSLLQVIQIVLNSLSSDTLKMLKEHSPLRGQTKLRDPGEQQGGFQHGRPHRLGTQREFPWVSGEGA